MTMAIYICKETPKMGIFASPAHDVLCAMKPGDTFIMEPEMQSIKNCKSWVQAEHRCTITTRDGRKHKVWFMITGIKLFNECFRKFT